MFKKISLSILLSLLVGLNTLPAPAGMAAVRTAGGSAITRLETNLGDYPDGQLPRYAKFEATLSLSAAYSNPFDPDEVRVDGYFTSPSHQTFIQPGFYYQAYRLSTTGGAESYTPAGDPIWKVRFTPAEVGTYQYFVRVTDRNGSRASSTGSFEVIPSSNPGFIRVSKLNPRYFGFDSGEPFIGIGLNVAWWQDEHKRLSTYAYYLNRMHQYQANLARVWMTNSGKDQSWVLSIQDKALGKDYDLEKAWAFDRIIDLAQEDGVYFLLSLDDVNQYTYNWPVNLYNSANGGPCAYRSCIFTDPTAKKYQEQVFRYILARWGYSRQILSWELFNEIDELQWSDPEHWFNADMLRWHQEMAQYIRSIDAHQHLIDTSTGSFKTHADLYGLPEMDIAQIHFYYVPGCCSYAPSDPAGHDIADLTRYYAHLVYNSVTDKPSIIGEWGLLDKSWNPSPSLKSDLQGISLHNSLWSSLMSGMAATGLDWNWASYPAHDPAWWQAYAGIASYFKDVPITGLEVIKPSNAGSSLTDGSDDRPEAFSLPNARLRVMGLRSGERVYAWIQNADHTWWNYIHGISPKPQSGVLTIYGMTPGESYTVEWWDPYADGLNASSTATAQPDGTLRLDFHPLLRDVAVKIYPVLETESRMR